MRNYAAAQLLASMCSLQAASCSCVPGVGQRRQDARFGDPWLTSNANLLPCASIILHITDCQASDTLLVLLDMDVGILTA